MRKSKFTQQQRLDILAEHDAGLAIAELCRKHQISPATFYKWRKMQTHQQDADQRRLAELEAENKRLKKMYAELSIDHDILQQGYQMAKKFAAQNNKNN